MIVHASLVIDAIADPGPRGKAARAALAARPPTESDVVAALSDAESFEVGIEATPWGDVRRGWELSQASLRYADAIYVAAAEWHQTALMTADARRRIRFGDRPAVL